MFLLERARHPQVVLPDRETLGSSRARSGPRSRVRGSIRTIALRPVTVQIWSPSTATAERALDVHAADDRPGIGVDLHDLSLAGDAPEPRRRGLEAKTRRARASGRSRVLAGDRTAPAGWRRRSIHSTPSRDHAARAARASGTCRSPRSCRDRSRGVRRRTPSPDLTARLGDEHGLPSTAISARTPWPTPASGTR